MPLIDIQARVKGKRQRFSSVNFPEADCKNGKIYINIKLEEGEGEGEDADLEEPLISLVSKLSKKKRRKLAQAGQSIREGSTTESTEDKCGTAMKKFCMDFNDSISPATSVKSEKVNPFSMDGLSSKDTITPVSDLVEKHNFLRCSFFKPLQKANEGRFESSESKCGTDTVMHSGFDGHMEDSSAYINIVSIVVNRNIITEFEHSGNLFVKSSRVLVAMKGKTHN